jgi:hypothetical protein
MKGMQKKIIKAIAESLGCDAREIQPQRLRSMGYNIIKTSHVQDPPSRDPKGIEYIPNVRKPTVKDSMLIQIREMGQLEGRDYVHSKYWVEIPKEMVTRILALNHLPDLKS